VAALSSSFSVGGWSVPPGGFSAARSPATARATTTTAGERENLPSHLDFMGLPRLARNGGRGSGRPAERNDPGVILPPGRSGSRKRPGKATTPQGASNRYPRPGTTVLSARRLLSNAGMSSAPDKYLRPE